MFKISYSRIFIRRKPFSIDLTSRRRVQIYRLHEHHRRLCCRLGLEGGVCVCGGVFDLFSGKRVRSNRVMSQFARVCVPCFRRSLPTDGSMLLPWWDRILPPISPYCASTQERAYRSSPWAIRPSYEWARFVVAPFLVCNSCPGRTYPVVVHADCSRFRCADIPRRGRFCLCLFLYPWRRRYGVMAKVAIAIGNPLGFESTVSTGDPRDSWPRLYGLNDIPREASASNN